jgi:hypothetical protein
MKKYLVVILFSASGFLFAKEKNVASFIGVYFGYTQNTQSISVEYPYYNGYYTDYRYKNEDFTYKYLAAGFSSRMGISDKINDHMTLYYLALLEMGLYFDLYEKTADSVRGRYLGEINYGAEIKCLYYKYSFGLALGTINTAILFARPSFGYRVSDNTLAELFFDYQIPNGFERAFGGWKVGFLLSMFK